LKIGGLYKVKLSNSLWSNKIILYVGMKEKYNCSFMTGRVIKHLFLINNKTEEFDSSFLDHIELLNETRQPRIN